MDESVEENGFFWWADEQVSIQQFVPANACSGTFKINSLGIAEICVNGELLGRDGKPSIKYVARPDDEQDLAVVGFLAAKNEFIRLEQIAQIGHHFSSSGHMTETVTANLCLVGKALITKPPPNRYVTGIRLWLDGFDHWLALKQLAMNHETDKVSVTFDDLTNDNFDLDFGTITIGSENYRKYVSSSEVSISQRFCIFFRSHNLISLDDAIQTIRHVEDIMILLTNSHRVFLLPEIQAEDSQIWSRFYFRKIQSDNEEIGRSTTWTTYRQIKDQLASMFVNWFNLHSRFGPGFHLFLGNKRGTRLFIEHKFMNLMWGLEAFHREKYPVKEDANLALKIERILSKHEGSDRRWLKGRLRHANETSLSDRLRECFLTLPIVFEDQKLKVFCERCAEHRNSISHYGGKRPEQDYVTQLPIWLELTYALEPLYHACILQEIGLNQKTIKAIFTSDNILSARLKEQLARANIELG